MAVTTNQASIDLTLSSDNSDISAAANAIQDILLILAVGREKPFSIDVSIYVDED